MVPAKVQYFDVDIFCLAKGANVRGRISLH